MKRRLPGRGDIAELLAGSRRPLHAYEVAAQLGVTDSTYPKLLELLDRMSLDGVLIRVPGNRFKAQLQQEQEPEGWDGVFAMHPRGFGFVNALGREDLFIAPDGIGGALHGDRVAALVVGKTSRGLEGRVQAVLERRWTRVAGVLQRRGKSVWLEPDDTRIRGPVVLSREALAYPNGSAAVVRITRYPMFPEENPEGAVVEVLGDPGDPFSEVRKILLREQIEETHSDAVLADAEAANNRAAQNREEGRRDLRGIPLPTIDPEDARDHDDAVWVERMGTGYRAYVAIADVSEFVQPGSELDQEAVRRGCSIYLPDRAIPMLPPLLSGSACSLVANQERLCLCVVADLDSKAKVRHFEIVEGVMKSAAALTYGEVARVLGFVDPGEVSAEAETLKPGLAVLNDLAVKLREVRLRRGALDLDLPEPRVVLDQTTGAPTAITRRTQDPGVKQAYQMIEELMLLANELVARWLGERQLPTVYRVHGQPDQAKLERLVGVCETLGVALDLEDLLEPDGVSRWLRGIEDHPRRQALNMLLLRSLKQATYQVDNTGHFGLASTAYLHFTSPIRRYPDLLVHRGVKAGLRKGLVPVEQAAPSPKKARKNQLQSPAAAVPPKTPSFGLAAAELEALRLAATKASERERAVVEIEREVVDLYRALYMRDHVGERFQGTVTGLVGSGIFVCLDDPFVDVLVRLEDLGSDQYEISDDQLAIYGVRSGERFSLGDRLTVEVCDVALLRRTVYARRIKIGKESATPILEAASPALRASEKKPRAGEKRGERAPGKRNERPVGRGGKPTKTKPKKGKSELAARGKPSKKSAATQTNKRRASKPKATKGKGRVGRK